MADLRDLLGRLGLLEPRSRLQSGNLVFRDEGRLGTELEHLLETEARSRLLLETAFFVRTAKEWQDLIARNPFREAERDPAHLVVVALKEAPKPGAVEALRAAIPGPELVRIHGREAYVVYPEGIGPSRLTNALIERKLGTRGTARNWNTVLKLGTLAPPRDR